MINHGKQNLLGVAISAIDYEYAVERIAQDAENGVRCIVTALAVHGVLTGVLDPGHRQRLNSFDLVTPDGQPVRWALNLLYRRGLKDKVAGPRLTQLLCEEAAKRGLPIYLYGSLPEVLDLMKAKLESRYSGIQFAGMQASRFRKLTPEEQIATAETIRQSGAKLLFVGLGCPRQEVFAFEIGRYLNMPVLAVGAAFDYSAGLLVEPPQPIQKLGLQWLVRVMEEPRRLWRRYLTTNSQFVFLFLAQWLRIWHPTLNAAGPPPEDVRFG